VSGIQGRSPRVKRAVRKKMRRKFKVGDLVTWGLRVKVDVVVEVTEDGLFIQHTPKWFVPWSEDPVAVPKRSTPT
jgi:hypothetical protein